MAESCQPPASAPLRHVLDLVVDDLPDREPEVSSGSGNSNGPVYFCVFSRSFTNVHVQMVRFSASRRGRLSQ
jgi:hypothetical protein